MFAPTLLTMPLIVLYCIVDNKDKDGLLFLPMT